MTLTQKILATLDASVEAMSTKQIADLCGQGCPDPRRNVWSALWRLEKNGLIERHVEVSERARSKRRKFRAVCVSCNRERSIECRGACFRCYQNPQKRPKGPWKPHKVAYWTVTN